MSEVRVDSDVQRLLQSDFRAEILDEIGEREWITVYDRFDNDDEKGGLFAAVLPTELEDIALSKPGNDLDFANERPGCFITYDAGEEVVHYDRFGQSNGIQPMVIHRYFNTIRPSYQEVLEEFRLFHNLYHTPGSSEYIKIDTDGNEHVVVRVTPPRIEMHLHEIRQFLALKESCLVVYFDCIRDSTLTVDQIPEAVREEEYATDRIRFSFHVASGNGFKRGYNSFSRLFGKKIIPPLPKDRSGMWPYADEDEGFESFIIGVSNGGDPLEHTCDPDELANYFGANPEAPHYLTPVFFRQEVLGKYYAEPRRYEVSDGHLSCGDLWGLHIDNDHATHVIAFLGDLGRDLSRNEQRYWRSFNTWPEGHISDANFRRSFLAQFANPERPDLAFKHLYVSMGEAWELKWGWPLFRSLKEPDSRCLKALHVPLADDQREFDEQVLNLAKLVVDALDEEKLAAGVSGPSSDAKGIGKLKRFLEEHGLESLLPHLQFLRDLQALRSSGVAHLKGSRYDGVKRRFGINGDPLPRSFEMILVKTNQLLEAFTSEAAQVHGECVEDAEEGPVADS